MQKWKQNDIMRPGVALHTLLLFIFSLHVLLLPFNFYNIPCLHVHVAYAPYSCCLNPLFVFVYTLSICCCCFNAQYLLIYFTSVVEPLHYRSVFGQPE